MTEERNEVYEIKKESVKQFLLIVVGSCVGCFLAILLAGQILKPHHKCSPHCRHLPPPPHAQMHHPKHLEHRFVTMKDDKAPVYLKKIDKRFEKKPVMQIDKADATTAK